jgi:hypothetical protein
MLKGGTVLVFFLGVLVAPAFAHGAPRGQAKATVAGKSITVDYGRPSLQGRDMLAKAQPGDAWRMGADAPTTLATGADLSFGAVSVPKGTYILTATKDDKGGWTLNIRNDADRTKVVADVPLTASTLKDSAEEFTIELRGVARDKGELELQWGTTALGAAFTGK